ncbi:VWA domain-containing protein [Pontiellaceae bacterium B1224]|nr:VWA domain-containing protein [Pontiellaceae bacterium B1224]
MPVHFYNPSVLLWLWLVPVVAALFIRAAVKRTKALQAFGATNLATSRKREAVAGCLAIALVVLALAQPAWNLQEQQLQESGRDVIFLLDVSRSMLADDMHPNRLENAKTAILDCVEDLSGDRVALVLFAGSAEIRCPLTVDYDYFRMALRQASPESLGAGGTMIAHALERTVDKLINPENAGMQDLILITDGEDLIDGPDEVEAMLALEEAGVRFIGIGIGDRSRGSRISLEDEETGARSFMKHGNTEVWTKLHSETLRRMAAAISDGIYFDVGSGPFNLDQIYRQIMANAQQTSTDKQVMERYEEKFHLFLSAAVIVLFVSNRWRKQT